MPLVVSPVGQEVTEHKDYEDSMGSPIGAYMQNDGVVDQNVHRLTLGPVG